MGLHPTNTSATTIPDDSWQSGLVTIADQVVVMAQYPLGYYWNGFLCPSLDAGACVEVLETLNRINHPEDQLDWHWDDQGNLVVVDRSYLADGLQAATEVYTPDEDGLYGLGAWCWTWQEWDEDHDRALSFDDLEGLGLDGTLRAHAGDYLTWDSPQVQEALTRKKGLITTAS